MKRKITAQLKAWKDSLTLKPLMVAGPRRVGKTFTIAEFCRSEFSEYAYVNLLDHPKIISTFKEMTSAEDKFNTLKLILGIKGLGHNSVVFIDEVQECEELISLLKYASENEIGYRIVVSGNLLGVKLKDLHVPYPVGRLVHLDMNPMDFEEFLMAIGKEAYIKRIEECYTSSNEMNPLIHDELTRLYKDYLFVGGMPESVDGYRKVAGDMGKYDAGILRDVKEAYFNDMNRFVISTAETKRIEKIYNSVPSQLMNKSHKFQYAKVDKTARRREYELALYWLLSSRMVHKSVIITKLEVPALGFADHDHFKLYLSDTGLLNRMLDISYQDAISGKVLQYSGIIAENYVATQLVGAGKNLMYWVSDNDSEIDFLLSGKDGIIPVEVKSADNTRSKSLLAYMDRFKPAYGIRISSKNFGFSNGIKTVPLYAAFMLRNV